MNTNNLSDLAQFIFKAREDVLKERPQLNILTIGNTGVGKSTLLNAMLGEDLAITGKGSPVTSEIKRYYCDNKKLDITDTVGLEIKDFDRISNALQEHICDRCDSDDINEQIHLCWFCIAEPSARIQDAEIDLIKFIFAKKIPIIIVLTKSQRDDEFKKTIEGILKRNDVDCNIIQVNSTKTKFMPVFGLDELEESSFNLLDEGRKEAFSRVQTVNKDRKDKACDGIINRYAALALGVGATPIPFSDAFFLVPLQLKMIVEINDTYNVIMSDDAILKMLTAAAGPLIASVAGRALVGALFKMFPGAGSIVGGIISGSTAGALTYAMGIVYKDLTSEGQLCDAETLGRRLADGLKKINLEDLIKTFTNRS